MRQVNSVSGSESDQTEFVLNSDGELVARNAEFGMAENGLMSASTSRPVEIEFELESAEKAYDYFINLVRTGKRMILISLSTLENCTEG